MSAIISTPSPVEHAGKQMKLLMIGDSNCNKGEVMRLFVGEALTPSSFISTLGIDFKFKNIEVNGKRVRIQIWDTAGQERFATILASHLRGAHGVMLVYDVANRASFEAIRDKYLPQVDSLAEPNVAKVLMGHAKADSLSDQRAVTHEEAAALAHTRHIPFFETSADQADSAINDAFMAAIQGCISNTPSNWVGW